MKQISNCCEADVVPSGIPFDGTNLEYTKMCGKCGRFCKGPIILKGQFPGESVDRHFKLYGHLPELGCCEYDQP